jgi:hypothetical protein
MLFYGYYTIEIASIMLPREAAAAVFFFGLGHFGTLVFFPVKINKPFHILQKRELVPKGKSRQGFSNAPS